MNARVVVSRAVAITGAAVLIACQPPAPQSLSDADRAALKARASDVMKTINAKDYAAWAAMFTDDAEWLPANGPAVKGRAAIQASVGSGPVMSSLALTQVDVDGRGDLAYVRGTYAVDITPPGAPMVHDTGKYIEIWRKQGDGSWQSSDVIVNSDLPLPAPAAMPPKKK